MSTTRRYLPLALSVALLLLLSCIDFDGQSLVFRHDQAADRLYVFQLYQGIHATGDQPAPSPAARAKQGKRARPAPRPSDKERRQLDSVVKGQRTFFFGNWITEYDRQACVSEVARASAALAEAKPEERPAVRARVALCEQLLKTVKISNGEFFLDRDKRLCGYQLVVVEQVSKLLPLVNAAIQAYAQADPMDRYSPAARDKVRAFARDARWVELRGNELRLRFYERYDDFIEFRDDVLGKFKRGQIVINYDEPLIEVIIGRPDNARTELVSPASSKPDQRLIRYVRKTYGLAKGVDVAALRDRFLEHGVGPAPASTSAPASAPAKAPSSAPAKKAPVKRR